MAMGDSFAWTSSRQIEIPVSMAHSNCVIASAHFAIFTDFCLPDIVSTPAYQQRASGTVYAFYLLVSAGVSCNFGRETRYLKDVEMKE
jgi:hypothetical protein